MNSSEHFILILIAILTCFVFNSYKNLSENFTTDSVYAPIGVYGIDNPQKTIPINQYANQVAYDLQNPFPTSTTGSNSRVSWDAATYREVQEPNGQFVGIISAN